MRRCMSPSHTYFSLESRLEYVCAGVWVTCVWYVYKRAMSHMRVICVQKSRPDSHVRQSHACYMSAKEPWVRCALYACKRAAPTMQLTPHTYFRLESRCPGVRCNMALLRTYNAHVADTTARIDILDAGQIVSAWDAIWLFCRHIFGACDSFNPVCVYSRRDPCR